MTKQRIASLTIVLMATGMIALLYNNGPTTNAQSAVGKGNKAEMQAVKKANDRFYAALNAMLKGDAKPFQAVWWHTDDIVYMGADGAVSVGWKQTYTNWKLQAALKIGGVVKSTGLKITVGKELAMCNNFVTGVNYLDGKATKVKLRVTSVYRKNAGVWKMICHHVDVIPELNGDKDKRK